MCSNDITRHESWLLIIVSVISKTAFRTPVDHLEYTVLSLRLINAVVIFQAVMGRLSRPHMDGFVVCHLDYILILSKTQEERLRYLRLVLEALRRE